MPGNVHGGESNPKCTMAAKLNTLKGVWWLCRLMQANPQGRLPVSE